MISERYIFSPLRVTSPTETESKVADAELLAAEDMVTALCSTEDGIAAWATLLGYGNVAPTSKSQH